MRGVRLGARDKSRFVTSPENKGGAFLGFSLAWLADCRLIYAVRGELNGDYEN
jgi:hypothetical protein